MITLAIDLNSALTENIQQPDKFTKHNKLYMTKIRVETRKHDYVK